MNNDYLQHYGVLGMKWGIRKARPTSNGRRRSSKKVISETNNVGRQVNSGKKKFGLLRKKTSKKVKQINNKIEEKSEEQKAKEKAAKKEAVLKSRSAKQLYDNADLFTTQELQSAYNRLVLERNIASLSPKEVSKGEQFVNTTIKWTTKTASLISSGTKVYNSIAKIYNATEQGKQKSWTIVGEKDKDK